MSDLPERLSLREVGPRDGLQNEDPVPTAAKVALIDALSATGVGRIEAVSFVHPLAIPQMADAAEVWAAITPNPDVRYSALVPNLKGAERALAAGFREIEVVVSASDTHNRKNLNRSTDESLDDIAGIVDRVHAEGATCQVIVATAWGCPYEGDVPVERVVSVASRALRDGADTLAYGDTTGMATPARVTGLVGETRSAHPDVPLLLHFHNTRGTGLANVLAALAARGQRVRRVGRRAGRLPLRSWRHREHRDRGARPHGGGHGRGDRCRPRGDDRRGGRGRAPRRPDALVTGVAGRAAYSHHRLTSARRTHDDH